MIDNFLAKARKLSILPTSLDNSDIQQYYVRIFYLFNPWALMLHQKAMLVISSHVHEHIKKHGLQLEGDRFFLLCFS